MQLTKQTDYAFRILMYLARLSPGEKAQIQQVCDFYAISSNHIAKVVMKLARLGYVTASRGKGGGIALGLSPDRINLAEVVRAFETTLQPVECDRPSCCITASCHLKGILFSAMQAFMAELEGHTLADLLAGMPGKEQKLEIR